MYIMYLSASEQYMLVICHIVLAVLSVFDMVYEQPCVRAARTYKSRSASVKVVKTALSWSRRVVRNVDQ